MTSTSFAFFALLFLLVGDNIRADVDVDKEFAKVRGKIDDLFACVVKESGFKFDSHGLNCQVSAEQKTEHAKYSVQYTPKSISDISTRLYDAGNKCMRQGGDFSGCCASKDVPKVCLPLCEANGTLDRDNSIFCDKYGKAIFECHVMGEKEEKSRLAPQFKSILDEKWSPEACKRLNAICGLATLTFDALAIGADVLTLGTAGSAISVAGISFGFNCAMQKRAHCPCKD